MSDTTATRPKHVYLSGSDKDLLKRLAGSDRRTMQGELSWLIEEELRRRNGHVCGQPQCNADHGRAS